MPGPIVGLGIKVGGAEVARRLEKAIQEWERTKCRIGGRRMRTACKTISPGDVQAFYAGRTVPYLVGERAEDLLNAWGIEGGQRNAEAVRQISGLSFADIAHLHTTAFVPVCLEAEGGHHTCHPEEPPGREFYEVSRLLLQDHIRSGRIRWRGLPRGGGAGDVLPETGGLHERIDCGPGGLHAGTDACRGIPEGASGTEAPNAPPGRQTGAPGTPGGRDPGPNPPVSRAGLGGFGSGLAIVAVGVVLLAIAARRG